MTVLRCGIRGIYRPLTFPAGSLLAAVYTGSTPGLHRVYTGSTPGLHRVYTGSTPGLHRVYTGSTPGL
ncbi:hypothetical protein EG028_03195, partial [Chitinophaga barathri]